MLPERMKLQLRNRRLLVFAALTILAGGGLIAFSQKANPVSYDDPQMIARGRELFNANCSTCHRAQAEGENPAGVFYGKKPDGSYWVPALNGTAHTWHHSPDGLFQQIKRGSSQLGSPMRGWKGRLSDREIHAVIAYFQSLWPEDLRQRYRQTFGRD